MYFARLRGEVSSNVVAGYDAVFKSVCIGRRYLWVRGHTGIGSTGPESTHCLAGLWELFSFVCETLLISGFAKKKVPAFKRWTRRWLLFFFSPSFPITSSNHLSKLPFFSFYGDACCSSHVRSRMDPLIESGFLCGFGHMLRHIWTTHLAHSRCGRFPFWVNNNKQAKQQ